MNLTSHHIKYFHLALEINLQGWFDLDKKVSQEGAKDEFGFVFLTCFEVLTLEGPVQ